MEKQQVITFIKDQLALGSISNDDLLGIAGHEAPRPALGSPAVHESGESSKNLIHTFYVIGAIIAVIGVAILIGQNWNEIGFMGRVIVSLGISLVTYSAGLLFRRPDQRVLSQVMYTVAAALAPLGAYVLLSEAGQELTYPIQLAIASVLAVIFGSAFLISRRNILVLITIAFATWAYYAVVLDLVGGSLFMVSDFLKLAIMLLGASYLLVGYGYQSSAHAADMSEEKEVRAVENMLYGLGTAAILGAGISFGGIFDLFVILFIFGAFYGSVYLKSRAMLIFGALFLMAHIVKLTSEYFVDSIGWPVALILIGFLVISVGYITFNLNKRFFNSELSQ